MAPDSDTPRTDSSERGPGGRGAKAAAVSRQRKYERKSPRFVWPEELHQQFVTAIFDLGLKNASPKALLALMADAGVDAAEGLTTEHLKSHLQKYRINQERSRAEFMDFYSRASRRQRRRQRRRHRLGGAGPATKFVFPICSPSRANVGQKESSSSSDSDSDKERKSSRKDSRGSSRAAIEPTTPCDTSSSAPQYEQPFAADLLINVAAASMGQQHLPPGYMVGNRGGASQAGAMLPEFADPQWNVLMAPALSGLEINENSTMLEQSGNGITPQEAAQSDMQTQMHLAMQAQMTLHRQMLTRKMEMAHHLAQQHQLQSASAGYNGTWRSHELQLQLQQQQYLQQQRQLNLFSRTSQPAQVSLDGATSTTGLTASRPPPPAPTQFSPTGPSLASGQPTAAMAKEPSDGLPGVEVPSKSDDETMNWDALSLDDDDLFSFLAA